MYSFVEVTLKSGLVKRVGPFSDSDSRYRWMRATENKGALRIRSFALESPDVLHDDGWWRQQ